MAAGFEMVLMRAAVRLAARAHAKPWGRADLGPWGLGLGSAASGSTGEIYHAAGGDDPILVKTLFTGERLSVQVHPDAAAARAAGLPHGKDEAWVVLAAVPGATIGIGPAAPSDRATLRAAALDGSIADLLAWYPCAAGDVFFIPAGTIHAIGGGITLFEVQQNLDVTYRLFDYGRGRELQLGAGLAVADPAPWRRQSALPAPGPGRALLVAGPSFVLERLEYSGSGSLRPAAGALWVAVVAGSGTIDGAAFAPGEVWRVDAAATVTGAAELLIAYPGARPHDVWRAA